MEKAFWMNSWELEGPYTSFHRKDIHPYLIKHLPPFSLEGKSVFVPLCGKSVDMIYFSHFANRVIGVEIVEKAVLQFFSENQLTYRRIGDRFISGNITIFCCDLFSLTPDDLGPIDVVYDRASLVALPDAMRMRYLQTLEELTPVGALTFLNTVEYAPTMPTPPFSISPRDVLWYFPNYVIDHVESPVLPNHGMVRKFNLSFLIEHGFLMRKLYNSAVWTDAEQMTEAV
ncbi:thiopurine S-methyltransferase [Spirosoma linguale]|uniref:thiopurine S-methyltransferase n=1 Tax=Spirosoma linguale (strain ATCC 33905 / DSM 74 / LMG 10896 / Claus 1) TaxID=504472 RepID=D2QUH2_SPILD|nr:Thiopurine S-methyltransferase [Spirosoma linguale DSM 74]